MASDDDTAPDGKTPDPAKLLKIAYTNSEDLLIALDDYKRAIKRSCDPSAAEAKRLLSNLTKSIQTVFDERNRLDDISARKGNIEGDATDYDALRAEIGRRLDELRAARDAADLPDQSE